MEVRPLDLMAGALPLFGASGELQFAGLAELALFAAGRKPALRFVLEPEAGASLASLVARCGYASRSTPVASQPVGNGWNSLVSGPSAHEGLAQVMVSIAREPCLAVEVDRLERSGSSDSVGLLLGYPLCCIAACDELARAGARWAGILLERSGPGPHPCWANRLAAGWGGISPVGELFPCSLSCPAATEIGQAAAEALRSIGLDRLASSMVEHALQPVVVHRDGRVLRVGSAPPPPGATRVEFTS